MGNADDMPFGDTADCDLLGQSEEACAFCLEVRQLTCAVDQLGVLRVSLNEGTNVCPADVALIDGKESLSCLRVILSEKSLQVLEAL